MMTSAVDMYSVLLSLAVSQSGHILKILLSVVTASFRHCHGYGCGGFLYISKKIICIVYIVSCESVSCECTAASGIHQQKNTNHTCIMMHVEVPQLTALLL
jgi:hypothetical protein